jgi:hypothetical protein
VHAARRVYRADSSATGRMLRTLSAPLVRAVSGGGIFDASRSWRLVPELPISFGVRRRRGRVGTFEWMELNLWRVRPFL